MDSSIKLSTKLKELGVAGIFVTCGGATTSEIPHSNELVAVNNAEALRSTVEITTFVDCTFQNCASEIISFYGLCRLYLILTLVLICYLEKNLCDVVFISKALYRQPNIVYQMAEQLKEIVFFPARDNVLVDDLEI